MKQRIQDSLTQWRSHLPEYSAELIGTAFNIFVGFSIITFDFGKGLPMEHLVPNSSVRLLINGLIFAGSGSLFAISPLGKLSGAHLNPCLSLAFWVQGKMYKQDLVGYIIAQFLGASVGTWLVVVVWGRYAASVNNGVTLPGDGYALWYVFLAEVLMTCLLVLSIFIFLSSRRLMRWTPLMTWLLVALMVWQGAPISGTSLNTARSIGPALVTPLWRDQWLYCVAPPLGALLAVGIFQLLSVGKRQLLTGKLFHTPNYRCIFKNVRVPYLHRTNLNSASDRNQT